MITWQSGQLSICFSYYTITLVTLTYLILFIIINLDGYIGVQVKVNILRINCQNNRFNRTNSASKINTKRSFGLSNNNNWPKCQFFYVAGYLNEGDADAL